MLDIQVRSHICNVATYLGQPNAIHIVRHDRGLGERMIEIGRLRLKLYNVVSAMYDHVSFEQVQLSTACIMSIWSGLTFIGNVPRLFHAHVLEMNAVCAFVWATGM